MRSASLAVDGQARWSALPVATRFVGYGVAEPSLVFYSGRHWTFADTPETLAIEMAKPGPLVVLTLVREADPLGFFTGNVRWRDEPRPPELTTGGVETEFSGFSPGRSRWQVVREWRRE
jgi:hypothetical protein